MTLNAYEIQIHVISLLLVLIRIGSFFLLSPFFGSNNVSHPLKMHIAILISFCIYMTPNVTPVAEIPGLLYLSILCVKEMTIGIILTFTSFLILLPFKIMGVQLGRIGGFGRAMILNVESESQFTVLSEFLFLVGTLLFFALNGHHFLLKMIAKTFELIPLGTLFLNEKILQVIIIYFTKSFNLGISFAAPILACILINSICFGLLSKSMPQMHLLIIDLPLRVAVGLVGIVFALPIVSAIFKKFMFISFQTMEKLIYIMSKGAA